MPVVSRVDGYRFFFYSNESREPAHIHVAHQDCAAKFWLNPVRLAYNDGFRNSDLTELFSLVRANETLLLEKWNEFFTR